jgi:excisionase family DNA binding protein
MALGECLHDDVKSMAQKIWTSKPTNSNRVGWKIRDWAESVSLSRAYTYELIQQGKIESVKVGGARIITTSPRVFLNRLDKREL